MEITFQILEIVLAIFKKHQISTTRIANGLNSIKYTNGVYLLRFDGMLELQTPFGVIYLHNTVSPDIANKIQMDLLLYFRGRFITVNNEFYLITHIRELPIKYPLVKSTTLYSMDELYNSLYKPRMECSWNATRSFYDNEIKRLVSSGWLTDDLYLLKELNENDSLMNYDRIILLLCKINSTEDDDVIELRSNLKQEKYIHIFGLLLLAKVTIHTH
jgi:hypothetical protein